MTQQRCPWCGQEPIYVTYHDTEWGVPERDSRALWEKFVLDGFQAGLSWITILKKRDNFRQAFAGFDPEKVASFTETDVTRLLADPGIIRHRGKIEATIKGAQAYLRIEEQQGFADFLWRYVDGRPLQPARATSSDIPGQTPLSLAVSKAMKAEGFTFCGPTITYAAMQACGLVNDHLVTCHRHAEVESLG